MNEPYSRVLGMPWEVVVGAAVDHQALESETGAGAVAGLLAELLASLGAR